MKTMKDTKIEVSAEVARVIAETITKEIKNSRDANKKIYDRAHLNQNAYNQITRWMEEGKTCDTPWPGAADYFVPMIEWIIDAVWGRVLQALFSQEPYMTATGEDAEDKERENGVTEFVDMAFRELVNLYSSVAFFFKQTMILPGAVLKYDKVYEYDRVITKEKAHTFLSPDGKFEEQLLDDEPDSQIKALQFQANGYEYQGQQDVWAVKDKALKKGPEMQYIKFEDYVWAPDPKKGQRLYWEGDRIWLTINEIMMKKQMKHFRPEAADKLKKLAQGEGLTGSEAVLKERGTLFEGYHWYGRFPFNAQNKIDFQDPEAIEQEVHCIVEMKNVELLEINQQFQQ